MKHWESWPHMFNWQFNKVLAQYVYIKLSYLQYKMLMLKNLQKICFSKISDIICILTFLLAFRKWWGTHTGGKQTNSCEILKEKGLRALPSLLRFLLFLDSKFYLGHHDSKFNFLTFVETILDMSSLLECMYSVDLGHSLFAKLAQTHASCFI